MAKKTTQIAPVSVPPIDPTTTPDNNGIVVMDSIPGDFTKITDPVVLDALIATKIMAIRKFTFMGYMVMSTNFLACDSIPTMAACVIGKQNTVILNEEFFIKGLKNDAQRLFGMLHELMHIFLFHIGRQTENCYDLRLWNVATDYMINSFLWHMNKDVSVNGYNVIELPDWVLHDERFYKKSADEIYHILLKENNGDAKKAAGAHGEDSDITVVIKGNGKGKQRSFDQVGKEPMTAQQKTAMTRTVAASIAGDSRNNMKEYGEGTAELFRLFASYNQERVDWKSVLREYIVRASKTRSTYSRVNRRSFGAVIFPSMTGDHINIVFGGDSSGSMGEGDLGEVRDEIKSVMTNFESWEMDIVTCDTSVYSMGHFSSEEGDAFENIDLKMKGGGGTDMNPIIEYSNDGGEFHNNDGDIVNIIVTDGYMPDITVEAMNPTIIVITTKGNKDFKSANDNVQMVYMED